jgi:hypothetical protein
VRIARALAGRGVVAASIDYRLLGERPVPSRRVAPLVAALAKAPISTTMATAVDDTLTAARYLRRHARRLGTSGTCSTTTASRGRGSGSSRASGGGIFVPAPARLDGTGAVQLERGEPALFAVHGDSDPTVPVTLDDQLVARARRRHVRTEYHRIPGGGRPRSTSPVREPCASLAEQLLHHRAVEGAARAPRLGLTAAASFTRSSPAAITPASSAVSASTNVSRSTRE